MTRGKDLDQAHNAMIKNEDVRLTKKSDMQFQKLRILSSDFFKLYLDVERIKSMIGD